jgi:ssDNA-binding Zn-finger/Zn-ribbon topoisomerase 1
MIITDKRSGEYTIKCDSDRCEESANFSTDLEWKEFLNAARKIGWKTPKDDQGKWRNYCPICSIKRDEDRAKEKQELMDSAPKKLVGACPKCGKDMFLRKSKFGGFYGCSGFPGCTEKMTVKQGIRECKT